MAEYRKFRWVSSIESRNEEKLSELNSFLELFYSSTITRNPYNSILDRKNIEQQPEGAERAFLQWFSHQNIQSVLEIGCGLGWMQQRIKTQKPFIQYTGAEVSKGQIEANSKKWPDSQWVAGSVYDLSLPAPSFDLVFSFYVLEHLVYPKRGLEAMVKWVKPGGYLALVFPDFVEKGSLPSQYLGFGLERTAMEKLKKGKILDALISLFDSRLYLPFALKKLKKKTGRFWVNCDPVCLKPNISELWPDIDAIYIANKIEIENWAMEKGLNVTFPNGKEGFFAHHAFMILKVPS